MERFIRIKLSYFFMVLTKIAREPLLVEENGSFDLSNLNRILQREAAKKNLVITTEYIQKENKYEFVVYEKVGRRI